MRWIWFQRNRDVGRCRAVDAAAKSLQLRETNRHFWMPNDFESNRMSLNSEALRIVRLFRHHTFAWVRFSAHRWAVTWLLCESHERGVDKSTEKMARFPRLVTRDLWWVMKMQIMRDVDANRTQHAWCVLKMKHNPDISSDVVHSQMHTSIHLVSWGEETHQFLGGSIHHSHMRFTWNSSE